MSTRSSIYTVYIYMNIGANVDFNLRTLGFFGNFTGENYGETGNWVC